MYLFVGWALSCWLLSNPDLGIAVGSTRIPAVQYADDTTAGASWYALGLLDPAAVAAAAVAAAVAAVAAAAVASAAARDAACA